MNSLFPWLLGAWCLGGAIFLPMLLPTKKPEAEPTKGTVVDLIERLSPLTRENGSPYGWQGVSVSFSGAGVQIDMTLKNGSNLKSAGKSLDDAVRGLSTPNADVQKALDGWQP